MFANALLVTMGKSFSRRPFGLLVIYGKNDHCQLMVKVNNHSRILHNLTYCRHDQWEHQSETTVKNDHCTFCEIQTPYIWPHPMYIPKQYGISTQLGLSHQYD